MGNKKYVYGSRKERDLKKKLEGAGYIVVRSAGSKGMWDLIAVHKATGEVLLIQVKSGENRRRGKKEAEKLREELKGKKLAGNIHPLLYFWDKKRRVWVVFDLLKEGG